MTSKQCTTPKQCSEEASRMYNPHTGWTSLENNTFGSMDYTNGRKISQPPGYMWPPGEPIRFGYTESERANREIKTEHPKSIWQRIAEWCLK